MADKTELHDVSGCYLYGLVPCEIVKSSSQVSVSCLRYFYRDILCRARLCHGRLIMMLTKVCSAPFTYTMDKNDGASCVFIVVVDISYLVDL